MTNQEIKEKIGASWRLVLFHPRFYCGNKKLAARALAANLNIKYQTAVNFVSLLPAYEVYENGSVLFRFGWSEYTIFKKTPDILISQDDFDFFKELELVKSVQRISKVTSGEN